MSIVLATINFFMSISFHLTLITFYLIYKYPLEVIFIFLNRKLYKGLIVVIENNERNVKRKKKLIKTINEIRIF